MPRLENDAKAGYYPTPDPVTDIISSWISAPAGGRMLDPCGGKGEALIPLAEAHNLIPYGVELHHGRASEMRMNVDRLLRQRPDFGQLVDQRFVLAESFYALNQRPLRGAFNLIYANPPYVMTEDGRAEYAWLRDTRPLLQPGGLMIWVIPRHMLYNEKVAPYLCTWFDDIRIFRFPDPFYDRFKQVVVFGRMREVRVTPEREQMREIRLLGQPIQVVDLPILEPTDDPYELPALTMPQDKVAFRSVHISAAEAILEAHNQGAYATKKFQEILDPGETVVRHLRPLLPMKIGHLVGVIAAGFLNNHVLEREGVETERLLIKGHSFKERVTDEKTVEAAPEEDHDHTVILTSTDRVMTRITTLTEAGDVVEYENADMQDFLRDWLPSVTRAVTEQYPPLYNFDYNGYEEALNKLNRDRLIPIVNKPGLLPAQRHTVAAIATRLEHEKDALIDGEMGTGKTIMGAAVPAVMAAKGFPMAHIIVLCPPHLVDKWQREIGHVWPQAQTMVLTSRSDVDKLFAHPGPIVGVMKETTARAGSGWLHAYNYLGSMVHKPRTKGGSFTFLKSGPFVNGAAARLPEYLKPFVGELKEKRHVVCPTCGAMQLDEEGVPAIPSDFSNSRQFCGQCRGALFMDSRRRSKQQDLTRFKTAMWRAEQQLQGHGLTHLHSNEGYAKYPLATYIKRKYKGMVDMLIADECHQYKAADSDRGYAYHRLAASAKRILNLTGTTYGGKASTLFYLLYRSSKAMRHAYAYQGDDGLKRWLDDYGIMQEISEVKMDEHGMESGNSRSKTRVKELPGNSPAILPWLLNRAAFVSLKDMGMALPTYQEIPVGVAMEPAQAEAYDAFEMRLTIEMRDRLVRGDKSLLGGYLQALLTWPDSPWRNKRVVDKKVLAQTGDLDRATVAAVAAQPDDHLYPKEAKIIDLIKTERENGRRSLLLCQQTSTLNITPQWVAMLAAAGLKAEVLKVEPNRREAWVKRAVERGVDVIITHPKRVETGLDLLDFPTIIWMGTEYSVYTILQASRRSWRIGQSKEAKVYFFYYRGTLQEKAMRLIAAKVKAALRMRGDTIPDESIADMDVMAQDDMVSALTKMMLEDGVAEQVDSLEDVFAKMNEEIQTEDGVVGDFDIEAIRNDFGAEPEIVAALPSTAAPVLQDVLPVAGVAEKEVVQVSLLNRLVFGRDQVPVKKPKRRDVSHSTVQLSLFR